jgi:hypothetical protein
MASVSRSATSSLRSASRRKAFISSWDLRVGSVFVFAAIRVGSWASFEKCPTLWEIIAGSFKKLGSFLRVGSFLNARSDKSKRFPTSAVIDLFFGDCSGCSGAVSNSS